LKLILHLHHLAKEYPDQMGVVVSSHASFLPFIRSYPAQSLAKTFFIDDFESTF
jgi:hypothetical protein